MQKLIILAALVGLTVANHKDRCPWVMGKYPFDEQKFAGPWKVVAGSYIIGTREGYTCTKLDYQVNKDSHVISYSAVTQEGKTVTGEAYGQHLSAQPEKAANSLAVWRKVDGTLTGIYKQSVVFTDYDTYAVFVSCQPLFDEATKSFSRHLKAGIMSRPNQTLSSETVEVLKNVISSYDIELDSIKMIEHTNC